jgi:hypothetical protein
LREILGRQPVVIGNVYDVRRRCGNPSCHCAKKPTHLQTLLIYVDKGRRRCRFVRQKDAAWVKRAWQRYGSLRKALKEYRAINYKELGILRVQIRLRGLRFPLGENSGKG